VAAAAYKFITFQYNARYFGEERVKSGGKMMSKATAGKHQAVFKRLLSLRPAQELLKNC